MSQPQPLPSPASSPSYSKLVRKRRKLSVILSLVMLVSYVAFILLIAFNPAVLGQPIAIGSPITLGIPVGIGLIALALAITGIYVHLSNTEFDALTDAARRELLKK